MTILNKSDRQFLASLRNDVRESLAKIIDETFGRTSPTVACATIQIVGEGSYDMYDHAPGVAYYSRDEQRSVVAPAYTDLETLKRIALAEFQQYEAKSLGETYDGMFTPIEIRIKDGGETLDLYASRHRPGVRAICVWLSDSDDLIPPSDWQDVGTKLESLRSEASLDAAWDNFDSARKLRNEADWLKEKLKLSQRLAA